MVARVYMPSRNIGERNGTPYYKIDCKWNLNGYSTMLFSWHVFDLASALAVRVLGGEMDVTTILVRILIGTSATTFAISSFHYVRAESQLPMIATPSASSRHRLLESRIENHLISSISISRFIPDSRLLLLLFLSCRLSLRQPDCVVYAHTARPQNGQ